ncbi:hypothetical protein PBRA_006792 [Plasmodiophora brassicae]|uniref:SCP domain-containing protein n=1 Tax=Plasmodiophora brassicae TaxID=37360 RepID=A0A0G4ITN9_PLABS|nr:hypothetical protein PBRA_006792 [Plasmodiophora brassicae]
MDRRAALRRLCAEAGDAAVSTLRVLAGLMKNARGNDERRRIRLSNPALFEKLTRFDSAVDVLESCGWEFIEYGDPDADNDVWMGVDASTLDVDHVLDEIESQRREITGDVSSPGPPAPSEPPPLPAVNVPRPVPAAPAKRSKLARSDLADIHERRLRGAAPPPSSDNIQRGVINVNPAPLRQLREVRRAQHQAWLKRSDRKRSMTLADLDAKDAEEEARIARIGRYAQRDRVLNSSFDVKGIGERALAYTNEFRATRGLPALKWHQYLADIGADHSRDMVAGKVPFSHDGFDSRVAQYPMKHTVAAENIARIGGGDPARQAVNGWINSPGHCKNLLLPNAKWCGIGVVPCGSQYMFTQLFG